MTAASVRHLVLYTESAPGQNPERLPRSPKSPAAQPCGPQWNAVEVEDVTSSRHNN